jgi:hypothetical protein
MVSTTKKLNVHILFKRNWCFSWITEELYIATCLWVDTVWIVCWIYLVLLTQITANNYNSLTILHNQEITTAANKCHFFSTCCLVVASNNGDTVYCYCVQQLLSSLAGNWLLTTDSGPEKSSNFLLTFTISYSWFLALSETKTMFLFILGSHMLGNGATSLTRGKVGLSE